MANPTTPSVAKKKRVTLNLAVRDARNLFGYLRDCYTPTTPEREVSRERALRKLEHQLSQIWHDENASKINN